jgi:hypothetical protein
MFPLRNNIVATFTAFYYILQNSTFLVVQTLPVTKMARQRLIFSDFVSPVLQLTKIIGFIFMLGIWLISGGCDNDPPGEPVDQGIWKKYQLLSTETGLMNSASLNGHLNAWSVESFVKDISFSTMDVGPDIYRTGPYAGTGRLKFPMAQNYFVFTDFNKVIIRSALTTESQSVEKIIDLKNVDGDFLELIDIPYWQGECMALSENGLLLIPYRAVQNGVQKNTPYFLLAKINSPENEDNELHIESIKLIRQDIFPGMMNINRIQTFFDCFYLWMGTWTYSLDADGQIDLIMDKPLNLLKIGSDLYAFAPNFNTGMVDLYKSTDQGSGWIHLGNLNEGILADLQYVSIHGSVIGFRKSQIYEVSITDTNYSISELDNKGLSLADITSVSLHDDNMVFVTSRCNSFTDTCGAYYKPLDLFFNKKNLPAD